MFGVLRRILITFRSTQCGIKSFFSHAKSFFYLNEIESKEKRKEFFFVRNWNMSRLFRRFFTSHMILNWIMVALSISDLHFIYMVNINGRVANCFEGAVVIVLKFWNQSDNANVLYANQYVYHLDSRKWKRFIILWWLNNVYSYVTITKWLKLYGLFKNILL